MPRRCETVWQPINSAQIAGMVRCWVGAPPARFRYDLHLETRSALGGDIFGQREDVPAGGRALDRWIATAGSKMDLILWTRTPHR